MKEALIEIARDLPHAMFCAAVVGLVLACIGVWSGVLTGVL